LQQFQPSHLRKSRFDAMGMLPHLGKQRSVSNVGNHITARRL
jgi:hypothetical protein